MQCCPKFDPKPWENKTHAWKDKRFIKDSVFTIFYMPVNFGHVIRKLMKKMDAAGAKSEGWMGLSDHTSPWNMDIYVAVDKNIPKANNVRLTGKYFSKVYEGDFRDTKKWCDDYNDYAKKKNLKLGKMYMWYTTCPKCAKKYGKNYVVIISEVKDGKKENN